MNITQENLEYILQEYGPGAMLHSALQLLDNHRPEAAVPLFRFLAAHEPPVDPRFMGCAQNLLAFCLSNGLGAPEDHNEAVRWLRAAGQNGHTPALRELARYYDPGSPLCAAAAPKNWVEALHWYQEAARMGDVKAMLCLVDLYMEKKNPQKAQEWLEKAAAHGSPDAVDFLGMALRTGESGMECNPQKAVAYLRQGMKMGLPHCYLFYAFYLGETGEIEEQERVAVDLAALMQVPLSQVLNEVQGEVQSPELEERMSELRQQISREWSRKTE